MFKLNFSSCVCAIAALLLLSAGWAQAASYLHVAFYSGTGCTNALFSYVATTSSPRMANQFLDMADYQMFSPNGCPTNAAAGTILPIYYDFVDELRYNVSLNSCTVGATLGSLNGDSYRAVCSTSEISPFFATATFQQGTWANQTVCDTVRNAFSRKSVFPPQACLPQGPDVTNSHFSCFIPN
jgi:hypothetical protein